MNVYIDVGAYDGDTIDQFKNWSKMHYGERDWKIYAFEPNPKFQPVLKELASDDVIISNKAAWIEDTEVEFAVDSSPTPLGSTLMEGKHKIWNNNEKIKVEAFDLSNWLRRFDNDIVVLKLDVEGAEFPILEKMLKDGTITIPNRLMVEFHPNKVVEYTTTDKDDLIKRVREAGGKLEVWH